MAGGSRFPKKHDYQATSPRETREIQRIAAKHGASSIRVFGSVAGGEARNDSDIDFLVDTGPVTSSWFPAGLVLDLEEILGRRVEVVTERGLSPLIKERVLQEAVPL